MSFGNSDSFMPFLVAVEISWWGCQFKSHPIERLFLKIIISSCISLNVVLAVFSQLSFQFHVNLSQWHSLPVSRCNLRCELIFKAFWVLFVDWYTFQFQFFLLRLFKDIVILNYCLNVFLKMNLLSCLSSPFHSFHSSGEVLIKLI